MLKADAGNTTMKNWMTRENIKEQLILSILEYEKVETTDLSEKADKIEKCKDHCLKSVRIRSYSGPHFPASGLNTEKYVPE